MHNFHTICTDSAPLNSRPLRICAAPHDVHQASINFIQWFLTDELSREINIREQRAFPCKRIDFPKATQQLNGRDRTWVFTSVHVTPPHSCGLDRGEAVGFTSLWVFFFFRVPTNLKDQEAVLEREKSYLLEGNSR